MFINKKKSTIKNVTLGKNVTIIEPVNLYGCTIGDNCFIGPFVEIQQGVVIGNNTRIRTAQGLSSGSPKLRTLHNFLLCKDVRSCQ